MTLGTKLALVAVLTASGAAAVPAQSATNGDAALRLTFTTTTPGASTGVHVDVRLGSPIGSDRKPLQLTGAKIRLPKGTVVNTSTRTPCTASDAELQAAGTLGCPSDSQVGAGSLAAETGFGPPIDPLVGDDTVFNGNNELIEVVTPPRCPASGRWRTVATFTFADGTTNRVTADTPCAD